MAFIGDSIGFFDAFRLAWGLILTAEGRAALRAGPEVGAMEITRRSIKILCRHKRFTEAGHEAEILAAMHRRRGEFEKGLSALSKAVELFPQNWRAKQFLAIEMLKRPHPSEAEGEWMMPEEGYAMIGDRTARAVELAESVLAALAGGLANGEYAPTVSLMTELTTMLQAADQTETALRCAEAAVDMQISAGVVDPVMLECLEALGKTWSALGGADKAAEIEDKIRAMRDRLTSAEQKKSEGEPLS